MNNVSIISLKWGYACFVLADAALQYAAKKDFETFQTVMKVNFATAIVRFLALGFLSSLCKINWCVIAGGATLSGYAVNLLNTPEPLPSGKEGVVLQRGKSRTDKFVQSTLVSQILINVALVFFSESKLLFAALATLNLYTLYHITNRDWLQIVRETPRFRFTYEAALFLDDDSKSASDKCSICYEIHSRRYYFCKNHSYDAECLTSRFIEATDHFRIVNRVTRMPIDKNGILYDLYVPEFVQPTCPDCRTIPSQNNLSISVWDPQTRHWCDSQVTWIKYLPDQKLNVEITNFARSSIAFYAETVLHDGTHVLFQTKPFHHTVGESIDVTINHVGVVNRILTLTCRI